MTNVSLNIDLVTGSAIQQRIDELNRAFIELLRTAALLGPAEPLAAQLIGTSQEVIDLFAEDHVCHRMLSMSFGFPLVKARILDHNVIKSMVSDGNADAHAVKAITESFSLDIVSKASGKRRAA